MSFFLLLYNPPPKKKEFVPGRTSQNPQTELGVHRGYLCTVGENVVTVFPFCLVILTEGFWMGISFKCSKSMLLYRNMGHKGSSNFQTSFVGECRQPHMYPETWSRHHLKQMLSNTVKDIILWLITSYTLYKTLHCFHKQLVPLKKGPTALKIGLFFVWLFYIHVA